MGDTEEGKLTVCGDLSQAYLRWRPTAEAAAHRRILCIPDARDNAASFAVLGRQLAARGWDVVAVDPPGCGHTQHLPLYLPYSDIEEVGLLRGFVEALGWCPPVGSSIVETPVLLCGHGRGGRIALAYAACFAGGAAACVLLNAPSLSLSTPAQYRMPAVRAMRESIEWDGVCATLRPHAFDSEEAARRHLASAASGAAAEPRPRPSSAAVEALLGRAFARDAEGRWVETGDVRLRGSSQKMFLDESQQQQLAARVVCPVLGLVTAPCAAAHAAQVDAAYERRRAAMRSVEVRTVEGCVEHHMHIDNAAAVLAQMVPFLTQSVAARAAKL
eukprot:Rhum_TRINITY_DN13066_c0_g1::Rhum_TRINITY_DN13066_c0_g1_i1::g.56635::m.56635